MTDMTGRNETQGLGESERWMSVILGSMLVLSSLRRRDLGTGTLFALGGAALIARGLRGDDRLLASLAGGGSTGGWAWQELGDEDGDEARWGGVTGMDEEGEDEVDEASMESFPASDAPSWTPTSSVGRDTNE